MIQPVNEQNGRICIYRVSVSGPKRLLFVPWLRQVQGANIHQQIQRVAFMDIQMRWRTLIVLFWCIWAARIIGFRFIWSVGTWPLTFPLVWLAARPSCCCTQASWSVATGHIKNQGCRTRQAGKKEKKVLPWQCERLKSIVSSSDCHSEHRSGASQIYWWKWNTLSSQPVCAKQIISTTDSL